MNLKTIATRTGVGIAVTGTLLFGATRYAMDVTE